MDSVRLDGSNQGIVIATRRQYEFLRFDNNLAGGLKKRPVGRGSNGGKRKMHPPVLKVTEYDVW